MISPSVAPCLHGTRLSSMLFRSQAESEPNLAAREWMLSITRDAAIDVVATLKLYLEHEEMINTDSSSTHFENIAGVFTYSHTLNE